MCSFPPDPSASLSPSKSSLFNFRQILKKSLEDFYLGEIYTQLLVTSHCFVLHNQLVFSSHLATPLVVVQITSYIQIRGTNAACVSDEIQLLFFVIPSTQVQHRDVHLSEGELIFNCSMFSGHIIWEHTCCLRS